MVIQTMPSATCWAANTKGTSANILCDGAFFWAIATTPIPAITVATPKLPAAEKHIVRSALRPERLGNQLSFCRSPVFLIASVGIAASGELFIGPGGDSCILHGLCLNPLRDGRRQGAIGT